MKEKPVRVYLSGAITGTKGYKRRFKWYEYQLKQYGFEVINPAKYNSMLPDTCTHTDYMKVSLALLDICSMIYIMPGSAGSDGVRIEQEYAILHNKGNLSHLLDLPPVPPGYR